MQLSEKLWMILCISEILYFLCCTTFKKNTLQESQNWFRLSRQSLMNAVVTWVQQWRDAPGQDKVFDSEFVELIFLISPVHIERSTKLKCYIQKMKGLKIMSDREGTLYLNFQFNVILCHSIVSAGLVISVNTAVIVCMLTLSQHWLPF